MEATPHYNSMHSPINMGLQTIGLLYGTDFANALCIAVNCGYDTNCTGATVGALFHTSWKVFWDQESFVDLRPGRGGTVPLPSPTPAPPSPPAQASLFPEPPPRYRH